MVETALKALAKAGFDMKALSLFGKDPHTEEHAVDDHRGRYSMTINCELLRDKGILKLHLGGALEATDFTLMSDQVDTYLAEHGKLHGLLIHAKSFPGWKDLAAMLAQFKFVKDHIKRIERVAVVADGALADVLPGIANYFVHAQVRHFDGRCEDEAMGWIDDTAKAQINPHAHADDPRP